MQAASFTRTAVAPSESSSGQYLTQGRLAYRLEQPGIEPPTLWLTADLLYLLSYGDYQEF